ncbi:hypothetical protein Pfo_022815 [Paulownia fortunei]|nr:hypothetical protein Pfo_022815 [Paulownia fortunei]
MDSSGSPSRKLRTPLHSQISLHLRPSLNPNPAPWSRSRRWRLRLRLLLDVACSFMEVTNSSLGARKTRTKRKSEEHTSRVNDSGANYDIFGDVPVHQAFLVADELL